METQQLTCQKCKMTSKSINFYKKKDGTFFSYCKKCLTMHLDVFNPDTFLWILKEADVPYIKHIWDAEVEKAYAKDPKKTKVALGKYLSIMKLKQHKQYTYADSDKLNETQAAMDAEYISEHPEAALTAQQLKDQYENGLITEAEYKTKTSAAVRHDDDTEKIIAQAIAERGGPLPQSMSIVNNIDNQDYIGPGASLTEEDKLYLALKWGTMYKPNEWVLLEKNYNEMVASFSIADADSINALKMLCKANLKANQAIDMNDFDSFQKLSKVAEGLRKSAKWTAQQNEGDLDGGLNAIGKIVAFCEKEGGAIPRYDLDIQRDVIDTIIKDSKEYIKSLFYSDPSLSTRVEAYLTQRKALDEQKRQRELALAAGVGVDDFLQELKEEQTIQDEDVALYHDIQEEEKQHDEKIYKGESDDL